MTPKEIAKGAARAPRDQTESAHQKEIIREIRQTPASVYKERMAEAAKDYVNPLMDLYIDMDIEAVSASIVEGDIHLTIRVTGAVSRPEGKAVANGAQQMIIVPAKFTKNCVLDAK